MKLKKRLIKNVKKKYGVADLYFFHGNLMAYDTYFERDVGSHINVCSHRKSKRRIFANRPDIKVYSRMNHMEIERLMSDMSNSVRNTHVWFDITDGKIYSIRDLKEAHLIAFLAGL